MWYPTSMSSRKGRTKLLLALELSGDLAGFTTWFARSERQAIMLKAPPTKPPSLAQVAQRLLFRQAATWWNSLDLEQRASYELVTQLLHVRMTGYDLFMRGYLLSDWTDVDRASVLTGVPLDHP